jgi:Crp-like helix-turn-helix domain
VCNTQEATQVDRGMSVNAGANRLLDALPMDGSRRLRRSLSPVCLDSGTILFEPGEPIAFVDFPRNCVVSLVTPFPEGTSVEVASIGNEGIVGVPIRPGGSLAFRAISSVGGWIDRMDASTFLNEVEADPRLQELVNDYVRAFFGEIAQAAACNRLHSNEERLSRWLLMSQDRVGTDEFAITHELLGQILGSRRATVTLSAERLRAAGLIRYSRGRVTIVDRVGLEAAACECYRAITAQLDGVIRRAQRNNTMT